MKEITHAPGIAKVDFVNPHKNNCNPASSSMGCPVCAVGSLQTCHNDMRDTHSNSTRNEHGLAPKLINIQNGGDGGNEHENTTDTAREQRDGISCET